MKDILWSVFTLVGVVLMSYSQTKPIEKGSYLSTNKGEKIKLNLLDDNKYELVFYSGEYEVKGDSLLFVNKEKSADVFDLTFSKDKDIKTKKVKIKFLEAYYSFYLGTQNESQDAVYQKIKIDYDADPNQTDVELEIDRSDFIYLVYEGYDGSSNVSKYSLPKDINNVVVKYSSLVNTNWDISGYYDSKTNELTIGEKHGKNPLIFKSEKVINSTISNLKITPLESLVIPNWTYPGKEPLLFEDYYTDNPEMVIDSAVVGPPKAGFRLRVENNLKEAIAETQKTTNKFLVVYSDAKNSKAKEDFEAFIKNQETQIGYNFYDGYNPEYDRFNFYLTSKEDKKWLKNNKIDVDSEIVVLDNDGDILTRAKATLENKIYEFGYYGTLCKDLDKAIAFKNFKKVISAKKSNDDNLIAALNKISSFEIPYGYDDLSVNAEYPENFKVDYLTFDKKQVSQIWNSLITAHQKDAKPNMYLVETILKEIKNEGFTRQLFKEERILNDTDFLAIDYLIKHAKVIETERTEFNNIKNEVHSVGNISSELSNILSQSNYYGIENEALRGKLSKSEVISIYKKIIANGNGNYDIYRNYFNYLKAESQTREIDTDYLREFDSFFNQYLSSEKGNAFEQLDKLYGSVDESSESYYAGWKEFKEYCSNSCNESAWSVVEKIENAGFVKNAIDWSEFSLIISKNNAYYLDTLAQLYYKDGQKERAIKTQEEAVKYSATIERETAIEMKEVLTKMQNGTY